jgi:hypothetical protein
VRTANRRAYKAHTTNSGPALALTHARRERALDSLAEKRLAGEPRKRVEDFSIPVNEVERGQGADVELCRAGSVREHDAASQLGSILCYEEVDLSSRRVTFIPIGGDEGQAPGLVFARQFHQDGHFCDARGTPGRPKIEHHYAATQVFEGQHPAFKALEREGWRLRSRETIASTLEDCEVKHARKEKRREQSGNPREPLAACAHGFKSAKNWLPFCSYM